MEFIEKLAGGGDESIFTSPLCKKYDDSLTYELASDLTVKRAIAGADTYHRYPASVVLTIQNKRMEGILVSFAIAPDGELNISFEMKSRMNGFFKAPDGSYDIYDASDKKSSVIVLYESPDKKHIAAYLEVIESTLFKKISEEVKKAAENLVSSMFPGSNVDLDSDADSKRFITILTGK